MENKKTNANMSKAKKALSITLNSLIWLFVLFSLVVTIMVFSAQGSKDGVPSIFGKSLITISTNSMSGTFEPGDLVFMQKLDDEAKENLEEGQIITYHAPIDINKDGIVGDLNTHRIEKIEGNVFITKGDNNELPDNKGDNPYTIHASDIVGICTEGGRLPLVGNAISFLRSPLGFFLFIVLPLILFFLYELYNFISILVTERAKRAAATAAPAAVDEEEIKRRAIEEYLAAEEAKKQQEAATNEENNSESN